MSRILSAALTLAAASAAAVALPSAAYADMVASSCTTTYAGALATDVLVNGPVHDTGGVIIVGNFTPATFEAGATGPTGAYATCMI